MSKKTAVPFAAHGYEKMIYDIRMGPQAVLHKNVMYIVYHANDNGPEAHPHIISYDIDESKWSVPVKAGELEQRRLDHHFAPVIWIDSDEYLHILYQCHGEAGIHIVSAKPRSIEGWRRCTEICESISYPRVIMLPGGGLAMYFRIYGHMGYLAYIMSHDGGYTWTKPTAIVDFDLNPHSNRDTWSGSYHSAELGSDERTLNIGFVYFDESGIWKRTHPIYGQKLGVISRYNLYCLTIDLYTGTVKNIQGDVMKCPINKLDADNCKIWDTGEYLTNMPAILSENGEASFMLPLSEASPWKCAFYYVYRKHGEWKKVRITETNSMWSSCRLYRNDSGELSAYLVTGKNDGSLNAYGGGRVERWKSSDGGLVWSKELTVSPDNGFLYNNPRFAELYEGGFSKDYLLFFGWEGPGGPGDGGVNKGQAFLWK